LRRKRLHLLAGHRGVHLRRIDLRRLTRLMTLFTRERPVRTPTEHVHPAGVRMPAETAWAAVPGDAAVGGITA
jgi:hypothetical protein